jgi:hypothetical protein
MAQSYTDIGIRQAGRNQAGLVNRGHALVIDSGWREVADTALGFLKRFV